jgi:lipoyl(octanoyl) transferase
VTSTLELTVLTPGVVDYRSAWDEQRRIHEAVVAGEAPHTVLLLEHPSVYTAGKRAQAADFPVDGTPVVETDRGGEVTWHGPGQLVGYPIVRLPADGGRPRDVVAFVRRTEQLLIDTCAELGVAAGRVRGRPGVWVLADHRGPDRKIASVGVRVARAVSMHGFALNCNPDLSYFDRIVPCGMPEVTMTSLTAELGRPVTVAEVIPVVEGHLPALLSA